MTLSPSRLVYLPRQTPAQKAIDESLVRFNLGIWGRQSGKTTRGLWKMIKRPCLGRPGAIYWYVLQTHSAAEIAFNRYIALTRNARGFLKHKNESEKFVRLFNDATIFFKSGENYEDLRAETLDGCIIDEYRQQHPDLWTKVIRPMLARRNGWCDILTTPNGFDHSYDLYKFAKLRPQEWGVFHAPSTEAWWWTPEEVQSSKENMSEDEFAQEILAEFRSIGKGKVYKAHGLHNQITENPFSVRGYKWCHYLPITVGLDFNVGKMCWLLGQRQGRHVHYVEELAVENTNTLEMTPLLIDRVKDHKLGVVLIGDASGKSNKTSAAGETDYSIIIKGLKDAKIIYKNLTPDSNPLVKDRVNIMNSCLKSAAGDINFTYNPVGCPSLNTDLDKCTWKKGATGAVIDKSDDTLTHSSDAAGYPVCYYSNEWKPKPGKLKIIPR